MFGSSQIYQIKEKPLDKNRYYLRNKFKADRSLNNYKAKLVVKGFIEQHDVEFIDTYAHVVKLDSVRIIMSVRSSQNGFGIASVER